MDGVKIKVHDVYMSTPDRNRVLTVTAEFLQTYFDSFDREAFREALTLMIRTVVEEVAKEYVAQWKDPLIAQVQVTDIAALVNARIAERIEQAILGLK